MDELLFYRRAYILITERLRARSDLGVDNKILAVELLYGKVENDRIIMVTCAVLKPLPFLVEKKI